MTTAKPNRNVTPPWPPLPFMISEGLTLVLAFFGAGAIGAFVAHVAVEDASLFTLVGGALAGLALWRAVDLALTVMPQRWAKQRAARKEADA